MKRLRTRLRTRLATRRTLEQIVLRQYDLICHLEDRLDR